MPLEGLAKVRILATPIMQAMDCVMQPTTTWEFNWWSWMKPLVESSRLKESQKCSKTMLDQPFANKWDMCKKVYLNDYMENSTSMFGWKSVKESKQGESKSKRCKTHNAQTIFDDVEAKAKGVRALNTPANSLAHPRAMLWPNQCKEGTIEAKIGRSRVANKAQSEKKTTASTHTQKRCYAWSSS